MIRDYSGRYWPETIKEADDMLFTLKNSCRAIANGLPAASGEVYKQMKQRIKAQKEQIHYIQDKLDNGEYTE